MTFYINMKMLQLQLWISISFFGNLKKVYNLQPKRKKISKSEEIQKLWKRVREFRYL